MASRIFSIRLDDRVVEALEALQLPDDDSLNATAKRVLTNAVGIDVNTPVHTVNNDERLQELVDNKTAYLADAMNEIKYSLEGRTEVLEKEIEVLKLRLNSLAPATAIASPNVGIAPKDTDLSDQMFVCPDCGTMGAKGIDFTSEGTTKAGTPRLKCKHCNAVKVESRFAKQDQSEKQTWEQKASDVLDGVNWQ